VGNTNIVYIEDEPDYQILVSRILGKAGLAIQVADTGTEGIKLIEREKPGLVLLDINLPDTDGFSICKQLRATNDWKDLQVLMLTVRRQPKEWLKGFESGANDYVSKPLNPPEFIERVQACLKGETVRPIIGPEEAEYQLVQAALGGNRGAYDALIRQHKTSLLRMLTQEIRNDSEAEDLASLAITRCWERLHQFQGGSSFLTWLHRSALHEYYNRCRRSPHVSLEEFSKGEEDGWMPLALIEPEPAATSGSDEPGREEIRAIVSSIPRFHRKLLDLHFMQGMTYEEIAARTALPLGTVASRIGRAKEHLRRAWWRLCIKNRAVQ
jgi:RNA polymerase sigma factor (sigma-70 family)